MKTCVHCAAPAGKPHRATCAFVVLGKWRRDDPRGRVKDSKPDAAIAAATITAAFERGDVATCDECSFVFVRSGSERLCKGCREERTASRSRLA